jgi:hypothetical protein
VKSYLLSSLAFRFGSAEPETFARAFPHEWILWEPGAWKAPASTTHLLTPAATPAPSKAGEALALALEPRPDGAPLKLGRGAECDAIINDGTLSQVHLVFMRRPDGVWTVRDANSRNGSKLDAVKLEPGKPATLANGSRLVAAQVAFTFYNSAGMLSRLKGL